MGKCDLCEYRYSARCEADGECEDFFFDPTTLPEDEIDRMVNLYLLWLEGFQNCLRTDEEE